MTTATGNGRDAHRLAAPLKRNAWLSTAALVGSSGTLICCVLPAVMVAAGAGATLAGLVTTFPQLVWLSERKGLVFGIAGLLLLIAGIALWRARALPCPADAQLAHACARLRRVSNGLFATAVVLFLVAAGFAFVLPAVAA